MSPERRRLLAAPIRDLTSLDLEMTELFFAANQILFGSWLAFGIGHFSDNPIYFRLAGVIPELHLGLLIMGLGVLQTIGIRRRNYDLRRVGCMGVAIFWLFFGYNFYCAAPTVFAWPLAVLISIFGALTYWRLGFRHRTSLTIVKPV